MLINYIHKLDPLSVLYLFQTSILDYPL